MTLEEMQAVARQVVEALKASGKFQDVEYVEDHGEGEPLPIMFMIDGEAFVMDMSLA